MCGQLNFTVNHHNYITLIVHLYVYHNGSHAAHRAGPSAAVKTCIFFVLHPATQRFNLWWLVKQDFYYTRCWFCFLANCWPKTLKHRKITFCSLCAFCQICWIILCCCLLLQAKDRGQRVSIVIVSEGAIDHSGQPITANQVKEVLYYNQVFVHP